MSLFEKLGLAAMHRVDPERAHGLAIRALRMGLIPKVAPSTSPRLATQIGPLNFTNPVGLAAGFDKNAEAITPLSNAGFGFIELGAATPRPQPGNPKPRLFRLTQDHAAINRFGFNNQGMQAIADRLAATPSAVPRGLNLGANKDSTDRAADFATVLKCAGPHLDFATVNVSSPNTAKLRDLQGKAALTALLEGVMDTNAGLAKPLPIFLKIAPDLSLSDLDDISAAAKHTGLTAIIATNTTLDRTGLNSPHRDENGGLSGAPLFDKSTRVLAQLATRTKLPLIGVGGISNAQQAYAKITAGASALQLYTALVFGGMSLVAQIVDGLDALLERDGHATLQDAVGTKTADWL
jgi:dihydroorotate dehydrogenase